MLPLNTILQNRYTIIRTIGRGGMGTVYEAVDQRLGHTVAVKQFVHGDVKSFEHEARLLARLRHRALPTVSDHFVEATGQFLVMEFIEGDDLATLPLRLGTQFRPDKVLNWAYQLLDVLDYLHEQSFPIIHNDIKPANLKLSKDDQVKLLDFGLSIERTSQIKPENAGYTLAYAPPEMIRGEPTDQRSDLYSLGATLHMLLTGNQPPSASQRLLEIANDKPDPLEPIFKLNPSVPLAISEVMRKAMSLNPQQRFESAAEMRYVLNASDYEQEVNTIVVRIERDILEFTLSEQANLIFGIAKIVNIEPEHIHILNIKAGSVIVILEMPSEAAAELITQHLKGAPELKKFCITRVELKQIEGSASSSQQSSVVRKNMSETIKILFLGVNSTSDAKLKLDHEIRAIEQVVQESKFRDRFDIKQCWAVRVQDLQKYILRYTPNLVHISGHGNTASEIVLEDDRGDYHPVPVHALGKLFSYLNENLRCVVLNSCYSQKQAAAIAEHVDCVIGMSNMITDISAINFSVAFYEALGYGKDIKTAFNLGCLQISLTGSDEGNIPELLAVKTDPEKLYL